MTNPDIARTFNQLATMLELDGANPFRVRAYREAARVVESQGEPVESLAAEPGRLEKMPGIGKDLAGKIRDLVTAGTTSLFEEMKAKYPLEVVKLTELQGMGPKRVKTLFEKLHVRNAEDLERVVREGKLRELPGFGETLEQNILKALDVARKSSGRVLLGGAWVVAHQLAEHVRRVPGVEEVELAGSFRRRRDTIGDLDIVASGGAPEAVMSAFTSHPEVVEVLGRGDTKSSVRLGSGLQVDLRLVPAESFGAALLYFTGSKQHNIELRKLALEKHLTLNEYGLMRGDRITAGRTEEEIYRALGLPWIPPELREASGEIALAMEGMLPRLIEQEDLQADLHMHTDRTDGRDSLETMVRAARDRGYRYCAITDHSKALAMARGFDLARVHQSVAEIEAVRRQVPGIQVLHGLEVDILADGGLDLEDEGLALLDWVIVALHSRLGQPREEMTERVLRSLAHPAVCAMAHPTARMTGTRESVAMDLERVFERAAELGVAMEINAQPHRTDLSDMNARLALAKGVSFVIDTDAHNVRELDHMRYGVFAARRAGLTRDHVLNTRPHERFEEWLERRRERLPGKAVKATLHAMPMASAPSPPPPSGAARRPAVAAPRAAAKSARASKSTRASKVGTQAPGPTRRGPAKRAPRAGSPARAGSRTGAKGAARPSARDRAARPASGGRSRTRRSP